MPPCLLTGGRINSARFPKWTHPAPLTHSTTAEPPIWSPATPIAGAHRAIVLPGAAGALRRTVLLCTATMHRFGDLNPGALPLVSGNDVTGPLAERPVEPFHRPVRVRMTRFDVPMLEPAGGASGRKTPHGRAPAHTGNRSCRTPEGGVRRYHRGGENKGSDSERCPLRRCPICAEACSPVIAWYPPGPP